MFKVRVIPCLDVKDGRVVKGVNFVNLRDAGDPVEAAIAYDAAGADELCFLDITASHENRGIILDVVQRTAEACFMPLTVGGGVRTIEDIRALLASGADKVSINTAAVNNRTFVREAAEKFGDQCIVVAIDAKRVSASGEPDRWRDFHPWRPAADRHRRRPLRQGGGRARRWRDPLLTSMDRDGTRLGFDIPLTRTIADAVSRSGHRLGRGRHPRPSGRGHPRRARHRGARRFHLSFRRTHGARRQGAHGTSGPSDASRPMNFLPSPPAKC